MITIVSFLRGINVGGERTIRMLELKELYESMGFTNVTTYVQSGNVVCDYTETDVSEINKLIEKEIERRFGFPVSVILRDQDDFQRIIDGNPFVRQRNEDPSLLHVTFLSNIPPTSIMNGLKLPPGIVDECVLSGKEVYLFCPNGYGRTKLSNNFFERRFKVLATTRNWKTIVSLYDIIRTR